MVELGDWTKIETTNVEQVEVNRDACNGFEITCPQCDGKVVVATGSWWSNKCDCGFSWSVSVKAIGVK